MEDFKLLFAQEMVNSSREAGENLTVEEALRDISNPEEFRDIKRFYNVCRRWHELQLKKATAQEKK